MKRKLCYQATFFSFDLARLIEFILTFGSINGAMAESIIEGEQQIDALQWVRHDHYL